MKRSMMRGAAVLLLGFLLCSIQSAAQTNLVPDDQEFQALKALYDSLGGPNWTNKTNWPTPGNWPATATAAQMGTWFGVIASNGDIVRIDLHLNNLSGKIPSVISQLQRLSILELYNNKITKMPASVGQLLQLRTLNLNSNQIAGNLPEQVGQLNQLAIFDIHSNKFTGVLPGTLASLNQLQTFNINSNLFTGEIVDLSNAAGLTTLILGKNNFTAGTIPSWIGALSNLSYLDLEQSNRNGQIPEFIGNLNKLTRLYLQQNQLSGSIPLSLGNLNQLTHLYLVQNQLTGAIPAQLGNASQLFYLNLGYNQLTGAIPATLGNLSQLQGLYLNDNFLTGSIPAAFGGLVNLAYLQIQKNQLSGEIPSSLGSLSKLLQVFIYQNKLSGELPSALGSLTQLQYFNLQANQLTGTIPSSFSNLTNLVLFYASGNKFSGTLPEIFGSMTKLTNLDLSANNFEGAFPTSIGSCGLLTYLRGDLNKFTSLPASLLTLPVLNSANFEGSELKSIPDFSAHVNKANLSVWVKNNRLDFSQLESLISTGIASVTYSPQKPVNDVPSLPLVNGNSFVLTARPPGQFSTVTWEKQNPNATWATLTNDEDSNPQTYTRTNATLADEGVYRWKMTNTKVTGLPLQSDPITVKTSTHFVLDDLAFQYKYDARKRMTHKKVPGADWVYMVYDDHDRLVMTQDGEQRKTNKWSFTKYDALNRPVMRGIYTHTEFKDQAGMSGLISTTNFFESYNGDATNHGYSKVVFPTTGTELLTVTYYDNYDFKTTWGSAFAYMPGQVASQTVNGVTYVQPETAFQRVTGQVTGIKTKILGDVFWLKTVNYYDDQYRLMQSVSEHVRKGLERVTSVYDFTGKVLATKTGRTETGILWKDLVNVTLTGDELKKTSSTYGNNAGAASTQSLPANQDGWIEMVYPGSGGGGSEQFFGFSDVNTNTDQATIDYALMVTANSVAGNVRIYENGVLRVGITGIILKGDVLRIERVGTQILYKVNGVTQYVSTVPSTTSLMADVTILQGLGYTFGTQASFGERAQSITRTFNYDHAGRLLKTWHSVNGASPVLLAENEYNELGQLVTKNLHNTDPVSTPDASRTFKQQLDYRYNIRGWLTRMNNSDVSITENGPRDYFGMNLFYNETVPELSGYQAQFNGNISAMKWSTNLGLGGIVQALEVDGPKENAYAFRYDSLNRLKSAAFHTKPSTGWGASAAYHEDNLKYDRNGNIKSLNRTTTEGTPMDQLTYAYSGNQLLKVSDTSDKTKGFVDGPSPDNDYTYDANGNMTLDRNKEITAITYNHLNLPDKVTKSTGEYVKYTYDATGRKLSQGVYNASNVLKKKSDYAGEFFYENDTLKFVNHEEGRVVMTGTAPEYQYHLKDHLGNVRMTFTTKEEVEDVKATMETASAATEHGQFLNYDEAVKVNSTLFNHTPNGTTHYSTRLRGSTNEQYGLAKSLSVMPGDTIRIEVFAKYIDPNTANWQQALSDLVTSIANGTAPAGTVVDGGLAGSIGNATFPYEGLLSKTLGGTPPKAFVNYIMFDRDVNPILDPQQTNFIQVSELAREDGTNGDHEHLYVQVIAKQAGLMYIYLSNDNVELGGSPVEVFFDDFRVEHVKSSVIQMDDYYPFGGEFNSYKRENGIRNQNKYNAGSELQDELGLEVYLTDNRVYDPWGRLGWWQVDPKVDELYSLSPYNYSFNNPIVYNDPKGDCPPMVCGALIGAAIGGVAGAIVAIADGQDLEGVLTSAAGGAVSGAIIGSGAGLISTSVLGGSTIGIVSGNAAVGFVAGTAESTTEQSISLATGRQSEFETAKVVKSATVGAVANVVAAPLGNAITEKISTSMTKATTQQVANASTKQALKAVTKEVSKKYPSLSLKNVNKLSRQMIAQRVSRIAAEGKAKTTAVTVGAETTIEAATEKASETTKDKLNRK